MEGRHDAPHGPEETDERTRARRRGEEWQVALEVSDFHARLSAHRTVHGGQAFAGGVIGIVDAMIERLRCSGQFLVGGDVELGERAVAKFLRDQRHGRRTPCLAKHLQEADGSSADATKLPPLLDDQRPADHREDGKDRQHELGDRSRTPDQVEDASGQGVRGVRQESSLVCLDHTDVTAGCQYFR